MAKAKQSSQVQRIYRIDRPIPGVVGGYDDYVVFDPKGKVTFTICVAVERDLEPVIRAAIARGAFSEVIVDDQQEPAASPTASKKPRILQIVR